MITEEIIQAVEDFIDRRGNVSFLELDKFLQNSGIQTKGNMWMQFHSGDKPTNIFVWFGMSSDFGDVFEGLKRRGNIVLDLVSKSVYVDNGWGSNLPVVEFLETPYQCYETQHWAPLVINVKKRRNYAQ